MRARRTRLRKRWVAPPPSTYSIVMRSILLTVAQGEGEVEEPDEDNMEEIDMDNIVGSRTRGKNIDYAEAAKKLKEEEQAKGQAQDEDDDDEEDEDFHDEDDEMKD